MVLLLDGHAVDFNRGELRALLRDQSCSQQAFKFQKQPSQVLESNKNLLFLHQREMGIITQQDPSVCFIGTDDLTTCHFIILDCVNAGLIGGAHLDGCGTQEFFDIYMDYVCKAQDKYAYLRRLSCTVKPITQNSDYSVDSLEEQAIKNQFEISVFVIGGFMDDDGESARLSTEILTLITERYPGANFHLELFAVTDINNQVKNCCNYPIIYGGLYNTRIHKMYPATFTKNAKEPCHILRSTRFCCSKMIYNIYSPEKNLLQLTNFDYKGYENRNYYQQLTQAPDSKLRKFSTSPLQEKEGYEASLRNVFKFMYDNPDPKLSLLDGDDGICYTCNQKTGEWELFH